MGLTQTLDIIVAHQYSHLREKFLHIIYDSMGVQLTETIGVCDIFSLSKEKLRAVRKNTYTREKIREKGYLWTQLVHSQKSQLVTVTGLAWYITTSVIIEDSVRRQNIIPGRKWRSFLKKCCHVVPELSTYAVTTPGNTNQNFRKCVKNSLWSTRHLIRLS